MNPVSSPDEIFAASKRVIDTLYGDAVSYTHLTLPTTPYV